MSGGKWVGELVGEIATSIRHEWERSWFGRETTPTAAAQELPAAEWLGWDVPGIAVQPEHRTNIDLGDFLSGDVSPITPNRDVGLGYDRTIEQGRDAPAQEHGHDMDR